MTTSCGLDFRGVKAGGKKHYVCSCGHSCLVERDEVPICARDAASEVTPIDMRPPAGAGEAALRAALDRAVESGEAQGVLKLTGTSTAEVAAALEALRELGGPKPPTVLPGTEPLLKPFDGTVAPPADRETTVAPPAPPADDGTVKPTPMSNVRILADFRSGTVGPNEVLIGALQDAPQLKSVVVIGLYEDDDATEGLYASAWSAMGPADMAALARLFTLEVDGILADVYDPLSEG